MATPAPVTLATLLASLNTHSAASLPRPLTMADCVFGDPETVGYDAANTQISFGTVHPELFGKGQLTLRYNRLDFKTLLANTELTPAENPATLDAAGIATVLNTAFGTNLTAADVEINTDIDIVPVESNNVAIGVSAAAGSVSYTGSAAVWFAIPPAGK